MGILFVWDDSYSAGNNEIDDQHRHLFDLANSVPENPDSVIIEQTIMALFKYVRYHFEFEERMMARIGYPKVKQHVELHNDLICQLNEISVQSFTTGESIFTFKKFVYDWIIDHISNRDKDYARFSRQLTGIGVPG